MTIKRAFLAAAAALMVPGFALAQVASVTFPTTIDFSNDFDGTVNVELTCNSGNPLVQDFDISEGAGVTFTVSDIVEGAVCSIDLSGLASGYELTNEPCDFTISAEGTEYACDLMAEPMGTAIEVNTTIDTGGDSTIDTSFETVISCMNVSPTTGPDYIDVTVTATDSPFTATWYADWDGGTDCTVEMTATDSAVEGDSCAFSFAIGDETAGCDVEGTVFFEGIPTLSQYGMALMALLMLGVGFIGFRRFV